jgi:hypothetical protein
MKKLIMFLLVHVSPNAIFSQQRNVFDNPRMEDYKVTLEVKPISDVTVPAKRDVTQPDTLRAIILVTLSPNGIAHARMGYVVVEQGKRPVYLDCRKRALKLPQVGWGWEKVGKN